jgi:hypothetical protein
MVLYHIRPIRSPQVTLESSTIERMKAHAEPLVDTFDTVVNRALDALDAQKAQSGGAAKGERILNPASPPNLAYTTVKSVVVNGQVLPASETYWNALLVAVIRESPKHLTKEQMRKVIICNFVAGKKEDNGYKYLEDVGLSIQGQDANNAWKATYRILQALKVPVEVTFVWQDSPKAVAPGISGKFVVNFD